MKHISCYNQYTDNLKLLKFSFEQVKKGQLAVQHDEFLSTHQDIISNAIQFLDDYTIKSKVINEDLDAYERSRKNAITGKLKASLQALFLGGVEEITISLLSQGISALIRIL